MKVFSFYLPQFHTFPENDEWWGKGFTEWTNTKKAKPLFDGHYQPHIPLNNNYYDLVLQPDTLKKQIELAHKYGVDGFCFYHYWFENNKKLMEKPVESFLANKYLDIEFCICWANENWTRRWDGKDEEVLIKQKYDDKNGWIIHFNYLKDYFLDKRYLKDNNGRPIVIIYKPGLIENLNEMLNMWNMMAREIGFEGLCFAYQYPEKSKRIDSLFDFKIEFEPTATTTFFKEDFLRNPGSIPLIIKQRIGAILSRRSFSLFDYKQVVKKSVKRKIDKRTWPGAFPSWDNTARRGNKAIIFINSSPNIFEDYVYKQLKKLQTVNNEGILFINAWNEWAEGAHLEPDQKFKYRYLEALKNAIDKSVNS